MKSSRRHLAAMLAILLVTLGMNCTCLASQAGKMFDEADKEQNVAYQQALSGITDAKQRELFVESERVWVKSCRTHGSCLPVALPFANPVLR